MRLDPQPPSQAVPHAVEPRRSSSLMGRRPGSVGMQSNRKLVRNALEHCLKVRSETKVWAVYIVILVKTRISDLILRLEPSRNISKQRLGSFSMSWFVKLVATLLSSWTSTARVGEGDFHLQTEIGVFPSPSMSPWWLQGDANREQREQVLKSFDEELVEWPAKKYVG